MGRKIGIVVLVVFAVIGALTAAGALGMLFMHAGMMQGFMCGGAAGSSEMDARIWLRTMAT